MAWTAFRHHDPLNNMSRAMYTGSIDVHPLLMEGFPGYSAGRGFDPAGGAPGGG
ncbi:dehydration-responsive element-binding protein 2B [Dorcoceras hygrometricum]|uniref:Dehydration-responsive element-binding protein 2B n=1 Tax=Dorcoceras hygrometricum TaxID=472368 RepID=A0A2Z7BP63_9LAMI|nr:dehydration-responsive element-binding protein 2B [Dorcoceras hygrometricum]